jgi:UDP-N-acetylmuramoyl-L-alanyl-D-glutamate--2,6-diaminopimelate ligase
MMRKLQDILYKAGLLEIAGATDIAVQKIEFNSNEIASGDLFVAVRGTVSDGHRYIQNAIEAGAAAIVCEEIPDTIYPGTTYVKVADSSAALGIIAANFYDNPSEKIKLIGVTGTNGKTTSVTLLYNLFKNLGYSCGLISTVVNKINDELVASTHTTPDPIRLNKLLSLMVRENCDFCFMEVSSHAVVQNRIAGVVFAGGLFSNITHDHLDYHKTFDEYLRAKKAFFETYKTKLFEILDSYDK